MPRLTVRMAPPFPRTIEALQRALVLYQAGGDRVVLVEAVRHFADAGRRTGVRLPALLGTLRTLWRHVHPASDGTASGPPSPSDEHFDDFARVLLAQYDRTRP